MLEVRLLGQFDISLDGAPIEITSRPSQSLFSYLILNPNTAYRREKLAGQFWPEASESNARNSLRQALWRIRSALRPLDDDDFFSSDSFTIRFNSNAKYMLDADLIQGDQATSTQDLIEAVSAYKGELLPGFYDDWVILARERLQVAYEHKMQLLLERLVVAEAWQDVIQWGEHWIAQGQVPELAYRGVMIAHGELGDTSKAASVYQRCVEALREELGVQPSAETTSVYEMLARGEKPVISLQATHRDSAAPIPEPRFPKFLEADDQPQKQPFVARENELARMQKSLEEALAGEGGLLFVQGEAGSGKTALIQAFARKAQAFDSELLVAHGSSNAVIGVGEPYLPFRELLDLLTGDLENVWSSGGITREIAKRLWTNLPYAVRALAEHGPDLIGSFIPGEELLSRAKAYSPNETAWLNTYADVVRYEREGESLEQSSLFGQYFDFLQALASEAPLLLMLDDLQWADLGSVSLLFHLGRRLQEHAILVIGAYRPDELSPDSEGKRHPLAKVLAEFKRTFGDITIDLAGIGEMEGQNFVEAFLDTEPNAFGESFRNALYRHTDGHPLFTVELLRAMEARGDIEKDGNGQWAESASLDWEALPPKIEGVIEERLGRLNESQQSILSAASVEGNEFTAEVIARILGVAEREMVETLSGELDKRHRLINATRVIWVGEQRLSQYRFRHILFEKYLYENLDPVQRAHLHLEVGELLESVHAKDRREIASQLAHHFAEAGVSQKAVEYFRVAGEHAKQLSANEEAILHLNRGIQLLQNAPGLEKEELALQISLGAPLIATRGYGAPEAQMVFARARQLAAHVDDVHQLFSVMYALRSYYLIRAEHETAREIGEQLLKLAENEKEPALRLEALEAHGSTLFYRGELTDAKDALQEAVSLYDPQIHNKHAYLFGQDPGVASWSYLALTQWSLGYAAAASEASSKSLEIARHIAHPFSLALALDFAALYSALLRDGEQALALAHEAIATSSKHNFPVWLAVGEILAGWAVATMGQPEEGLMRMSKGIEAWEATGAKLASPYFLGLQAEALLAGGQINLGLTVIDRALEAVQFGSERVNEAELYRLRGLLLQTNEQNPEDAFLQVLAIANQQGAITIALRAALDLGKHWSGQGRRDEARKIVQETVDKFVGNMHVEDLKEAQAFLVE